MNMLVILVGAIPTSFLIQVIGIGVLFGKELINNIFVKNQYHH
jgi:hypothetical protein